MSEIGDNEEIRIDFLVGEECLLNQSVLVTIGKNNSDQVYLITKGQPVTTYLVQSVTDMNRDGSFTLTIVTPGKKILTGQNLVKKSLHESKK